MGQREDQNQKRVDEIGGAGMTPPVQKYAEQVAFRADEAGKRVMESIASALEDMDRNPFSPTDPNKLAAYKTQVLRASNLGLPANITSRLKSVADRGIAHADVDIKKLVEDIKRIIPPGHVPPAQAQNAVSPLTKSEGVAPGVDNHPQKPRDIVV